jgi:predicted SnoaL-like aldol condensation-catalyzing enzyme
MTVITESVEVGQSLGVNADLALAFIELAASGRGQEALDRYGALEFRHHNPFFTADGESLIKGMDEDARANPEKRLEVVRAIAEGPFVALHSRVRRGPGQAELATVHIFRIEDGKVQEMWDVAQEIPVDSPNENGAF